MNLMKNISLSLVLIAILLISVSSISASDADNIGINMNSASNCNGLSHLSDIDGLDHDDYYCTEDSYNADIGADGYNYDLETNIDNTVNQSDVGSGNDLNGAGKFSVLDSDDLSNILVIQNSNSENNKHNVDDVNNLSDIIKSSDYVINQTSENTYILTLADNSTMEIGVLQVFDVDSFIRAADYISTGNNSFDAVIIDFKDNLNINFNPWAQDLIKFNSVKNVIFRGCGATIAVDNPNKSNRYHFLNVNSDATVWMNNITLIGFNTAIVNYGTCQFTNVTFKSNEIDSDDDYGGAIRNCGALKCLECSFLKNIAEYGGAIYNDKGSQSTFADCFFADNYAYFSKESSLDTLDWHNIYTSRGASCLITNHNDKVQLVTINTQDDYLIFLDSISSMEHLRFLVLNFTAPITCDIYQKPIFLPMVENIYIYGSGTTFNVVNSEDSDEFCFLRVLQGQFCSISNVNINGFNQAINNQGSLSITDAHFKSNKVDYMFKEDYGGAIYNCDGLITLSDSTFEEGYAKYGGAIYNNNGIISCKNCNFTSNKVYNNGGAIYNKIGLLYCEGCKFISDFADSGGGAIFNHYGVLMLHNNTFDRSVADDGGAIYNDFGEIIIDNCTFANSIAENGKDIYNYGEEAKSTILGNSSVIEYTSDGIITKTIDVDSDVPSEFIRWTARIVEILLCVGMLIGITVSGMPEFYAAVVCLVGGGLLAGAEEVIEGVCLDHNFNIFNCIAMSAIAGVFDMVAGTLGSWVGHTFFSTATKTLFTLGAAAIGKIALINFAFDVVGEVITQVIPRFDFNNYQVPTTLLDLSNPEIP